ISEKAIYFIMERENTKENPVTLLKKAIKAGIGIFKYREKDTRNQTYLERLKLTRQLQKLCAQHNIQYNINNDIKISKELQDDMQISEARREVGNSMIIGISTSRVEEALEAEQSGADYIGVGPIYQTSTKKDAKQPVGLERLHEIRNKVQLPIVAIGGIKVDN